MSDTKYRDIADGNSGIWIIKFVDLADVRYQVPRYSGWKRVVALLRSTHRTVRYQVPRYSGWKHDNRDELVTMEGSQKPSTAI